MTGSISDPRKQTVDEQMSNFQYQLTSGDLDANRKCERPSISARDTNSPRRAGSFFSLVRAELRDNAAEKFSFSEGRVPGAAGGGIGNADIASGGGVVD